MNERAADTSKRRGDFARSVDETPLATQIAERIRKEGPISFHDFMASALYDPVHGYYAKGPRIGPEGDFSTSVRFPAFRDAIVRLVEHAWDALGKPADFRVVELGAGTGQLARHVTSAWRARHAGASLAYHTVDASPGLRARQSEIEGVTAHAAMDALDAAPGIVIGNEVLDALPVRRVVGSGDERAPLLEIHVDLDAATGRFRDRLRPLSDASIAARLASLGVAPARGQIMDVAPALDAFVGDAARLVTRGFLVLIDYGDVAPRLYAPTNPNGTLAAYRDQGRHHDPYARVGAQDLTADVDFTTVANAAEEAGLETLGLITQQAFLESLGIDELGLPDEVHMVAGAAGLGTAFQVVAFRRATVASLPGF